MRINEKISCACRIVIGIAFIVSAVLKFISLESFELYIYGFDWLNMALSSYAARAILAAEMLIGLSLVSGVKARWAVRAALFVLFFFSLFLLYLIVTGNDGNCHCFGEHFELKPLPSLGKNLVMMLLLGGAWRAKEWFGKIMKYILPVMVLWAVVFAFVLKAPYGFGRTKVAKFSPEKYAALVEEHTDLNQSGKQVVALFSTHCKHCKMAMRKLEISLRRSAFPKDRIQWFVLGNEASLSEFLDETGVEPRRYEILDARTLLGVTDGAIPLILLVEDGVVKERMSNATFDEGAIRDFCGVIFAE